MTMNVAVTNVVQIGILGNVVRVDVSQMKDIITELVIQVLGVKKKSVYIHVIVMLMNVIAMQTVMIMIHVQQIFV